MASGVLSKWKEFDTTRDPVVEGQTKGTREKAWIRRHARDLWLRKRPKPYHHSEVFAEVTSVRLARAVGIPSAEAHATTWNTGGDRLTGAIVKEFGSGDREQIVDGDQLIRRYDQTYDPTQKEQHTLARLFASLERAEQEFGANGLTVRMTHVLTFDCWIGNADRHQGNWSLIRNDEDRTVRLAPLYDTTACFMREPPSNPRKTPGVAPCMVARALGAIVREMDALQVIWRSPPADEHRCLVGVLRRDGGEFVFEYLEGDGMALAESCGFRDLPEFSRESSSYRASFLFPSFANRIPLPSRPDYNDLLDSWGVTNADDQLEILARSGGFAVNDPLEFAELRDAHDRLREPLHFRLAGQKHFCDAEAEVLEAGSTVAFERDDANAADQHAVKVVARGQQIGWVPRPYAPIFCRLIDSGATIDGRLMRRCKFLRDRHVRWVVVAQSHE